jgi:hypothetical protein
MGSNVETKIETAQLVPQREAVVEDASFKLSELSRHELLKPGELEKYKKVIEQGTLSEAVKTQHQINDRWQEQARREFPLELSFSARAIELMNNTSYGVLAELVAPNTYNVDIYKIGTNGERTPMGNFEATPENLKEKIEEWREKRR